MRLVPRFVCWMAAAQRVLSPAARGWMVVVCLALGTKVQAQQTLETVTLQLRWMHQFQFAGYYAAQEKGYYREAGLEVNIVPAEPGLDPVVEVMAGRAEFGTGMSSLLLSRLSGQRVVVLANIFQHSPLVLIMRQTDANESVHSLVGKRIMFETGEDEIMAYLAREGVSADSYTRIEHSFNPQDIVTGRVDAMTAYLTDEVFYLKQAGFPHLVFTPRSAGIDFYGDNLFTSEEQIRRHPARVRAFRDASLRGWSYALQHPDEMIDLIVSRFGSRMSRDHLAYEARQTRALMLPDLVPVGFINPGRWEAIARTYAALDMAPAQYSLQGFLYVPESGRIPRWAKKSLAGAALVIALGIALIAYILRINRRLAQSGEYVRRVLNDIPIAIGVSGSGQDAKVDFMNAQFVKTFGYTREDLPTLPAWFERAYPDPAYRATAIAWWREAMAIVVAGEGKIAPKEFRVTCKNGTVRDVLISGAATKDMLLTSFVDVTERKQAEAEREKLIADLRRALQEIKTLQGLLPICSECKKVRDDKGFWQQVDHYIGEHSEIRFSHGMCPDCVRRLYPDIADDILSDEGPGPGAGKP